MACSFPACGHGAPDPVPDPPAAENQGEKATIFTLWPLLDYRSSPETGYSNLSLLGPLFKREHDRTTTRTGLRPLFFTTATSASTDTELLYPIASASSSPEERDFQILRLFRVHTDRPGSPEERRSSMLFPFWISGESERRGPYTSLFPIHGSIYDRFWRDEYQYTLFPLYGRTVKGGTTRSHFLYPFFGTVSGPGETGFRFWPLYGEEAKEEAYERRFVLWPFFSRERLALNTDNPVHNLNLLPFYAASESPHRTSVHAPWPFCGTVRKDGILVERDIFWPFWMTVNDGETSIERYLPFYASTRVKDTSSRWLMWPIYRSETIDSASFRLEKISLFYFLFNRTDEAWPSTGRERSRSTFWPLYAYQREPEGTATLSLPAPVEPVVWNESIDRNWAPLWRIFITRWDNHGNSATSLLWNLYWHERRGSESAGELFPLYSWKSGKDGREWRILKGLAGFSMVKDRDYLTLFWMRFGI